jgi:hypothetical protein
MLPMLFARPIDGKGSFFVAERGIAEVYRCVWMVRQMAALTDGYHYCLEIDRMITLSLQSLD